MGTTFKYQVPKFQNPNSKKKYNKMGKKNDLCERLLQFAVDVILYLRTVKTLLKQLVPKSSLSMHPLRAEQIMKNHRVLLPDLMLKQKLVYH